MIPTKEFEDWGSFYDPDDLELKQINSMVNLKDKIVLEIGCGTGRVTFKLGGYKKLTAIDKVGEYIGFCKKKDKSGKIEFMKAEVGALPFENALFDVVLATWSLGSENFGSIMWDVSRILKPNGVFLIIDESSLGEFEETEEIFCRGYKKMVRMRNHELKRQLERFFSRIDQQNLYIPEVYPNIETAVKWFVFELREWNKRPVTDESLIKKELDKFARNGKVVINRGVMFLRAT